MKLRTFTVEWGFDDQLKRLCAFEWGAAGEEQSRRCRIGLKLGPLDVKFDVPLAFSGVQWVLPSVQADRERRQALSGPIEPIIKD